MKAKRYGFIAALAAVLLATTLLVTTCDGPFGVDGLLGKSTSGKTGIIQLSLGGDFAARTIMPASGQFTVAVYEIEVTPTTVGTGDGTLFQGVLDLTNPGTTNILELDQGTYASVTVNAYRTAGTGNFGEGTNLIATGTYSTQFAVTGGGNTPITVVINALSDGVGTGTFSWNLSYGAGITAATMTITDSSNVDIQGTQTYPTDVLANANNTATPLALNSGFYNVQIVMTGATGFRGRTITEKLHIYENTLSAYAPAQFAALVQNRFTVNYHNPFTDTTGGTAHGTSVTNVVYGATIPNKPATDPDPSTEKDPSFTDWNGPFAGWWTADGSGSTSASWGTRFVHVDEVVALDPVLGTATTVIRDYTTGGTTPPLYARYTSTAASPQQFNVTFTAPAPLVVTLTASGMAVTDIAADVFEVQRSDLLGGTLTFSFTGAGATASRFILEGSTSAAGTATAINVPGSLFDGGAITVDTYSLTIFLTVASVEYSAVVTIDVK